MPFATRRPTTNEAERVCKMLGTVRVIDTSSGSYNIEPVYEARREKRKMNKKKNSKKKKAKKKKKKKVGNTDGGVESSDSEAALEENIDNVAEPDDEVDTSILSPISSSRISSPL